MFFDRGSTEKLLGLVLRTASLLSRSFWAGSFKRFWLAHASNSTFRANSRSSFSRSSVVSHSPSVALHFGQINICTNSPLFCAPRALSGITRHLEHTDTTVPLPLLIPAMPSIMSSPTNSYFLKRFQFGEMSNSVGSITAGNCTFNGVSIPRALHSDRNSSPVAGANPE